VPQKSVKECPALPIGQDRQWFEKGFSNVTKVTHKRECEGSVVTLKRTQVAFNDGTVATTHAQPIDAVFADYGTNADDANQAETEGDPLALLS
jgi:hypothetical protein